MKRVKQVVKWTALSTAISIASTGFAADNTAITSKTKKNNFRETSGVIQVGTDAAGQAIYIGYKAKGKNDGRPVLILADPYLGINSWDYVQDVMAKDYYTIAIDPIGYGSSSKNSPTNLDGIHSTTGYSFRQQAYFTHEFVEHMHPSGPITFVSVDVQSQVGMWYATDYVNSTYPLAKLFMEDASAEPIISDDPCSLAYTNTATMQQLVGYFTIDPVAASRALLGGTFITQQCPTVQQQLTDIAATYAATTTAEIFARIALTTFAEDTSPLMANINIPVLNTYGTTGDDVPVSRRGVGITFFGSSPGFSNPMIPGTCSQVKPVVAPFPNSRFITYPGHGTVQHLTSFKRFVRDLNDFVSGDDAECSVYIPTV